MTLTITKTEINAILKTKGLLSVVMLNKQANEIAYKKVCSNICEAMSQLKDAKVAFCDEQISITIPSELIVEAMDIYGDVIASTFTTGKLLFTNLVGVSSKLVEKWTIAK